MKSYLKITTLFALLIVATSCNHNSKNPIFEKFKPSSAEYKQELAKQLQSRNADDLTFLFNNYVVIDGKEYLDILIKGNGIDAQGLVLVNSWDKISVIKSTKPLPGAILSCKCESSTWQWVFINPGHNIPLSCSTGVSPASVGMWSVTEMILP